MQVKVLCSTGALGSCVLSSRLESSDMTQLLSHCSARPLNGPFQEESNLSADRPLARC